MENSAVHIICNVNKTERVGSTKDSYTVFGVLPIKLLYENILIFSIFHIKNHSQLDAYISSCETLRCYVLNVNYTKRGIYRPETC